MGLFSKKKKKFRELPPLPDELSKEEEILYEPQFKPEIPRERFRLPIEKPKSIFVEQKPIYIKIDKYKSAMKTLAEIKARLLEAEKILSNLQKIKNEEDQEFENWRNDIEQIKDKLLSVDKNLFEV